MNLQQRRGMVIESMKEQGVDLLLGFHDNGHFIEKPNPVMLLSHFKSISDAVVLLGVDGSLHLIVSPSWEAERAAERVPGAVATDDLVGWTERKEGAAEPVKYPGILDANEISRADAEALIMQARVKAGWIDASELETPESEAELAEGEAE